MPIFLEYWYCTSRFECNPATFSEWHALTTWSFCNACQNVRKGEAPKGTAMKLQLNRFLRHFYEKYIPLPLFTVVHMWLCMLHFDKQGIVMNSIWYLGILYQILYLVCIAKQSCFHLSLGLHHCSLSNQYVPLVYLHCSIFFPLTLKRTHFI